MNTPTTQDAADACSCPDFRLSRRRLLGAFAAVTGTGLLTSTFGSAFLQTAMASTPASGGGGNVVVVLSMRGGVDGLSLVVPWNDPAYAIARPTIKIPTDRLLGRDGTFGLHPQLDPVMSMWNDGSMAAVHAVGLPAPNRSHFAAMEAVEDADPGSVERRGWLNRLVGLDATQDPLEGMQIGSSLIPASLYGPDPVIAVGEIDDMFLPGRSDPVAYERRRSSLDEAWRSASGPLGSGSRAALAVSKTFEELTGEDDGPQHGAQYPTGDFGDALAGAARIIRSAMPTKVITIDVGDWDMHVDMGKADTGPMSKAINHFALGVQAFFKDLGPDADRVTVITISEFGRRVQENSARGLDHGWGNVMFAFGAGVKGGYHARSWPGLGTDRLVEGDLAVTTDYRSVLSEVVASRFGADTSKVFPGFRRSPVGLMTGV